MANSEHIEIIKRGKQEVDAYYKKIGKNSPFDLSNANFSEQTLEDICFYGTNLNGVDFTNSIINRCTFKDCSFQNNGQDFAKLTGTVFSNCNFIGVSRFPETFDKANFSDSVFRDGTFNKCEYSDRDFRSCEFTNINFEDCLFKNSFFDSDKLKNINFVRCNLEAIKFDKNIFNTICFSVCDFSNTDLSNKNFSNIALERSIFYKSNLKGVIFSNSNLSYSILDDSNLAKSNFYESNITGCSFKNTKGLEKAINLEKSHVYMKVDNPNDNVKYFDYCIRRWQEKWCDWEKLRTFGRLPLFGASYAALVFIPLFFYFLSIYNDKIDIVKNWAKQSVNNTDPLALLLIERLHPLPVPNLSLVLLLSTLCLAIASTIYALGCPSRIKEFSSDQWTDQLGHSLVHYWALSWKNRCTRLTCLVFYLVGGMGVLWVIGNKVFNAAIFIWNNSQFTF